MSDLFHLVLYQPLFNLMVFLYNVLPGSDVGLATIVLTMVVKLVLYPLTRKSLISQRALQQIQPKIKQLQQKYKNQKEKLTQETIKLYKREKVNPFSSIFPTLLQLPFLIAIYRVFRTVLQPEALDALYPFISRPESIDHFAFGLLDLTSASLILAVITGGVQYLQTRMLTHTKQQRVAGSKDEQKLAAKNKQMMLIMPIVTVLIGSRLPSGLVLYWLTNSLLGIVQQWYFFKQKQEPKILGSAKPSSALTCEPMAELSPDNGREKEIS